MAALVETTTQSLDSVTMAALLDTSKAADATDATDMSGVRVERSPLHGRGLFAARDFAAGETILVEAPLVAMQDLANRHAALVCGECLAFLDLGRDLLEAVARGASPPPPADAAVARGGGPVARCADGCGELYCSAACRDAHRRRCHRTLSRRPVARGRPAARTARRYKILATESNEILFLAADVVAAALADGAAAAAFLPFTRVPWDRVVTPEWLARIVGTFEQNNVGVRLRHPLDDDDDDEAEDDDDDDDEAEGGRRTGAVRRARRRFEDVDRLAAAPGAVAVVKFSAAWCAPCRAMAPVFAALAEALPGAPSPPSASPTGPRRRALRGRRAPDSCGVLSRAPSEPGGEPGPGRFGAPLRASLVARRAVAAGDELTIAYVDTDAPWQERRAALADYGFLCRCSRCVAEMRCPKCA
ncbi:methyltransferase [Aureococcus anophagefferens]|uniref:Methyltransferase n=1 Tax=Aureococcus anophagefferens TaxID=44056 RepID=A0ABR1FV51_AURAN